MAMYCGIGGAQKEIGDLYCGVGGVSKELNNIYAGIGGVSKEIYTAVQGQPLSALSAGSLLKLNETVSGVTTAVPFLVTGHDHFENGYSDLLRNKLLPTGMKFYSNTFTTSTKFYQTDVSIWLNGTYLSYFDSSLQSLLSSIIPPGAGASMKVYLLSATELGAQLSGYEVQGTNISFFDSSSRRIRYREADAGAGIYWTRSRYPGNSTNAVNSVSKTGTGVSKNCTSTSDNYVLPAFNIPATTLVSLTTDIDGCYTLI